MIILVIVFTGTLQAADFSSGYTPVNPPVSETVITNHNNANMPDFDFTEEAYIDDIPFDTECVSKNCIYQKALSVIFQMDEEQYINDIPFKTKTIKDKSAITTDFNLEDEDYINDIPFDTRKHANNSCNKMVYKN